jgi:LytS/YehU family sensor histidine kinase
MLKNYVGLENMKSGNRFDFIFMMDEEVESDFIEIPPMMVQVFVENAIKHGLSNIDYKGKLSLQVFVDQDHVRFVLEDNGSGIKQNSTNHPGHKSRAMGIFNQRKKLIERKCKKPLQFSLENLSELDSAKSGVRVNINLPILNND